MQINFTPLRTVVFKLKSAENLHNLNSDMKPRIVFVERKFWGSVSLEKVFAQVEKKISKGEFETSFIQMPYLSDTLGIIKNFIFFRKPPADIYHITGHIHYIALIFPKEKTVLTIPDLTILQNRKGLRRFIIRKLFFDLPIRKLKYITAISEATKNEIVRTVKCDGEKIRVIEVPVEERFFSTAGKTFDAECPTILQIGTAFNKNVVNLIKALNGINCRLRIIGKLNRDIENELEANRINYTNSFNLDDEEIRTEYQNADIIAFCSTHEGFGLPIIEGQATQTPVITSNLSPMKEVAGGGAALIEPQDVESIRAGIRRLINDETLRKRLIETGMENANRFDASRIAERYECLYREIIQARI